MKTIEERIHEFEQRQFNLMESFKAQLLKELTPKVEFEVGDYVYWNGCTPTKGKITKKANGDRNWVLSLDFSNISSESHDSCHESHLRKLTESEIKEALWNQFKKLGGKKGVRVERDLSFVNQSGEAITNKVVLIDSESYQYYPEQDILQVSEFTVYCKGKWATIQKEEAIKISTYEVKFYPMGETRIDGNLFTRGFWEAAKIISEHSKAKIMICCSKQFDVSLETINQILEKLK